jgi:hypothetical protein
MSTTTTDGGTPNTTTTQGGTPSTTTAPAAEPPATFDAWLQKQDEHSRKLLDEHVSGLKSALGSERTEKGKLAKQLTELAKKAEDGSALKSELEKLAADNETKTRRVEFLEQAATAGVSDLKLAWAAVQSSGDDFKDRKGNIDFKALQEAHPALFGKPEAPKTPPVNGAAGTGRQKPNNTGPNSAINRDIRARAGRT